MVSCLSRRTRRLGRKSDLTDLTCISAIKKATQPRYLCILFAGASALLAMEVNRLDDCYINIQNGISSSPASKSHIMRQHWSVTRENYCMMLSFYIVRKKKWPLSLFSLSLSSLYMSSSKWNVSQGFFSKITSWEFSYMGSWKLNDQPLGILTRSCPSKCSHWEPLASYIQMRSWQPLSLYIYWGHSQRGS